jgi:subtilisin family serine protease
MQAVRIGRRWRQAMVPAFTGVLFLPLLAVPSAGSPGAAAPGAAAPIAAPAAAPVASPGAIGGSEQSFTLVTGDKVTLVKPPGGSRVVPRVEAAPREDGAQPVFTVKQDGEDLYVLPSDATQLVTSGRLDVELFNVGYLAKHPNLYGKDAVPVVVQFDTSVRTADSPARARELSGLTPTRNLETLHAVGARVNRAKAGGFWKALVEPGRDSSRVSRAASGATAAAKPDLADQVTKVWLDREMKATLDVSVPLIGGPQAWAAGFDGKGVKVAVLDTGIDAGHPDFAGRITATENFSAESSAVDGNGHGTHVASILAGSGAASDGRFKGVAPGASLLIGKVLDNTGSGLSSGIIDGMEWATQQGADVVNMSLGTNGPSDGTDAMSQAVDRLTDSTGTLFVIAAGNNGQGVPRAFQVGSPGAASRALTVAANSSLQEDPTGLRVAPFSSAGPLIGTGALKPDIAAPGTGIAAARAAGTSLGAPVDDHYTRLSGTSMATPHVAGVAALLAQRFPDWHADRLKPALMSTSTTMNPELSVYDTGAGRVNAAQAATQKVFSTTPNLDFGLSEEPDVEPVTKTVTLANTGDQPLTLTLSARLGRAKAPGGFLLPVPDGVLTLGATEVTVPAGGTAEVPVTLVRDQQAPDGYYSGAVHASAPDGAALTVPVGFVKDTAGTGVSIRILDYDGQPVQTDQRIELWRVDTPAAPQTVVYQGLQGRARIRLEPGTYSIVASAFISIGPDGEQRRVLPVAPEVRVGSDDVDVVLDLRTTRPVRVATQQPSQMLEGSIGYQRIRANGLAGPTYAVLGAYPFLDFWINPTDQVSSGGVNFYHDGWFGKPPVAMTAVADRTRITLDPRYATYRDFSSVDAPIAKLSGRRNHTLVSGGTGTPEDLAGLALKGKLVLLKVPGTTTFAQLFERLDAMREAGAAGALVAGDGFRPTLSIFTGRGYPLPTMSLSSGQADQLLGQLQHTQVTLETDATPVTPYAYRLQFTGSGRIPDPSFTVTQKQLATVDQYIHSDVAGDAQLDWVLFPVFGTTQPLQYPSQSRLPIYVQPARTKPWWAQATLPGGSVQARWDAIEAFSEPRTYIRHTGMQPATPGVKTVALLPGETNSSSAVSCGMCREGDWLFPHMLWTTANPFEGAYFVAPTNRATCCGPFEIHMYRDGTEIPRGEPLPNFGGYPAFKVPTEPGTYRMTFQTKSSATSAPAGREIQGEWTFHSAPPTQACPAGGFTQGFIVCPVRYLTKADIGPGEPQPIMFLRYDLGLGLDNRLLAGQAQQVTVTAYHQPYAGKALPAIAGLKLWASFDRGAHWTPVPTERAKNGTFKTTIKTPKLAATSGTVSLRGEAWDVNGDRIDLTTLDAYKLK